MRTSPAEDDAHDQRQMLKQAVCNQVFADENVVGGLSKCTGLQACLAALKSKDILMVVQLDKLGRNLHEVLSIIKQLQQRGIYLISIVEQIDTTRFQQREIIERIFKGLNECERKQLVRRTKEGTLKAKAQGNRGGRPAKLTTDQLERANELLESGETHHNVADLLKVHRTTLTRNLALYSPSGRKEVEHSKNGKGRWGWLSRFQ